MTSPQSQHCTPEQRIVHDDEIDLKELVLTLWAGKAIVIGVTLLTIVCAAAYVFFTPAIYQASVTIAAPAEEDILALAETHRVLDSAGGDHTPINQAINKATGTAFRRVIQLTNSSKVQHRLLDNTGSKEASPIIVDTKKGSATLTLNGNNAAQAATNINQYAEQLIHIAQQKLAEDVNQRAVVLQASLREELASLRQKAAIKRQQTIAKLNEALALAESLDMEEPAAHGNMIVNYSGDTAYMRGGKALRNQIKLLEQRESDDDFIPELATIAEHQRRLEGIAFKAGDVQAARIDVPAIAPRAPIKPRKKLIMAVSVILGGMLGVFIVLIRRAFTD